MFSRIFGLLRNSTKIAAQFLGLGQCSLQSAWKITASQSCALMVPNLAQPSRHTPPQR
jgi:hypothetical protein